MAINIKPNDYKTPTEIREEVVQGICDAFLASNVWSVFRPKTDGAYRTKTMYIGKRRSEKTYSAFYDSADKFKEETLHFNGVEVNEAVRLLREAGYYLWKDYNYGRNWPGYRFTKTPVPPYKNCVSVDRITEVLD